MAIKDYSTEPDMNTTISGINIAEGCAPSGINNAIRQLMADVKAEKEGQATKNAAQDAAISAAQSSADAAQSSADAAQSSADAALAQAGEFIELLDGKADKTELDNKADKSELEGVVRSVNGVVADASGAVVLGKGTHITRTGFNAYGWYREWSDGWKEQGGNHGLGGASTLNFPLPFSDTTYSLLLSPRLESTSGAAVSAVEYSNTRTTTAVLISLRFGSSDNTGVFCSWFACGY